MGFFDSIVCREKISRRGWIGIESGELLVGRKSVLSWLVGFRGVGRRGRRRKLFLRLSDYSLFGMCSVSEISSCMLFVNSSIVVRIF